MMLERGEGAIVNIVDLSAWQPWAGFAAHSVGKAGLWALTQQLALELAPVVQVNAVAPGPVLPPPDYSPKAIDRTARRTLKNRWGSPQDVVDAVLFLVRANYITGEVIVVDGGERYGHHKPAGSS
jgi:3-oxoacyl-[acyl-carrier protein] reductase/pteridine reductase